MAKRGWSQGWENTREWAHPIHRVLDAEKLEAAARARELSNKRASDEAARQDAEREKARKEHVEALAQEQHVMKIARGDVLACLSLAAELAGPMRTLVRSVAKAAEPKPDGSPPDISPVQAMGLLTRHATLMQKAVGAAETIIQLGRLERGQPGAIVGVVPGEAEMTYEQALEELAAAEEVLSSARARGLALPSGLPSVETMRAASTVASLRGRNDLDS